MTELVRWVDDDATEAEERLLGAARGDGPAVGKQAQLLAALGVSAALTASTAAGMGAAGTAVTTTAAATPAGKAIGAGVGSAGGAVIGSGAAGASAPLVGVLKWIGIGLVAGAVTSGSLSVLSGGKTSEPHVVPTTPSPVLAKPVEPAPRLVELAAPAEPQLTPKPSIPSNAPATTAEPEPSAPDVAQEVATLDSAREAVRSGDARRALQALAEHERRFAGGVLAPEAELLRIQALIESGQRASAASRARAFLAKNGSSPHAPRVRALLARATAPVEGTPAARAVPRSTPAASPPAPLPASPSTPSTASFPAQ